MKSRSSQNNSFRPDQSGHDTPPRDPVFIHQQLETESPDFFRAAMEMAPAGIVLIDMTRENYPIVFVNKAFEEMTGHTREELLGADSRMLQGRDLDQSGVREFNQAIRHKRRASVVFRNYRKNGRSFWWELHLTPLFNAAVELTHYLCLANDVTAQKEARDDLLRIQRAVESSSDAIVIWNPDGTPHYWNCTFGALCGGDDPYQRLNPNRQNSLYENPAKMRDIFARLNEGQSWSGEIRINTPQNTALDLWLNADVIHDDDDNLIGLIGIHIDISQRKLAQDIHRLLGKLGEQLNAATSPRDVALLVANTARSVFPWDACAVALYNAETDRSTTILNIDTVDKERREFTETYDKPVEPSPFFKKALQQGAFQIEKNDCQNEPVREKFGNKARDSESMMFAPIHIAHSQKTGLISFQSYTPHAYRFEHLQAFKTLTEYCGAALQRCLVEQERQTIMQTLAVLNSVSLVAVSCTTPSELAGALSNELRRHFAVDSFFLDGFLPDTYMGIGFGNYDTIGGRFVRVPESPEPYNWLELPFGTTLFIEKKPILMLRTPEELRRMPPSDLWWPLDSPRSASLIFVPLLAGEKVTGVMSIQSYSFNAYTQKHLEQIVATGRQIAPVVESLLLTQQLRDRNQEMLESEVRFQLVCRATHDGVYDWNPLTHRVWRNDHYCRIFELTPGEAIDVNWWRRNVHPDDWPEVESSLQRVVSQGGERWSCVYRLRRASGNYLTVEDRAFLERDSEGRPSRMIGAVTDITECRRA